MSEPPDRADNVEAVIEAFADRDIGEVLDDGYDAERLESDREGLVAKREELASERGALETEYKGHLHNAANTNGGEQQLAREKAELADRKYQLKKEQHQKCGTELALLLVLEAVQDLRSATGDDALGVAALGRDGPDARAVRADLADALERFDIDPSVL